MKFIREKAALESALYQLDPNTIDSYIYTKFIFWLNAYATVFPQHIENYFSGSYNFNSLLIHFTQFCFSRNIELDEAKTLNSFSCHNQLSTQAIEKELLQLPRKKELNILGFGLGDGAFEKSLISFLLSSGKTEKVNLFGFDLYTKKGDDIHYLSRNELLTLPHKLDLILARWVLHHVQLPYRWVDLITSIKHCHSESRVLIVEHGFLKKQSATLQEKKLYYFLNGFFDVIANIALRPNYFTDTAPKIGDNFFIQYLREKDFATIKKWIPFYATETVHTIGPPFPNQTLHVLKFSPLGKVLAHFEKGAGEQSEPRAFFQGAKPFPGNER